MTLSVHTANRLRWAERLSGSGQRSVTRGAMAGAHSSHVYHMEEVLGMIESIDEPVCDGSDDDFGMQVDNSDSDYDEEM